MKKRPGPVKGELAKRRGDAVTYSAMHTRLRQLKGRAADHDCPCGSPARQWAYDHADPNEKTELRPDGFTVVYSADLDHYKPMCIPCHNKLDHPIKEKSA